MIRMGRYGQSSGLFTLDVGGYNKEIKFKVGDGRKFIKIISKAGDDKSKLFDEFSDYIYEVIKTNDTPQTKEEDEELKLYIDGNLLELLNEAMVAFRLTTREDIAKQKLEQKKKLNINGE